MVYLLIGTIFGFALAWAFRGHLDRRANGTAGDIRATASGGTSANDTAITAAVETNEAAGNAINGIQNLINSVRKCNSGDGNS